MLRHMRQASPLPPDLLETIATASPPPRYPRGYFDPLVVPTRQLLDRGFSLCQATDWLINQRIINTKDRQHFMDAIRSRISRLKRSRIKSGPAHEWRASIYYDSTHLVQSGERKALCGSTATAWEAERSESSRCCRCFGMARRLGIVTI